MHIKNILAEGVPVEKAKKVLILLHGRGGSAQDILSLAPHLNVEEYALLAPQATNHSWYPYSFMAPANQNEPWLSSAIDLVNNLVDDILNKGISPEHLYFSGFSQGACLCLEYVARHAKKYGGVAAFTGGLIGERIISSNYKGNFDHTPIYIGSGDPDPHVPVHRVHESATILEDLGAAVTIKIFPGMPHTITPQEIADVNKLIFTSFH